MKPKMTEARVFFVDVGNMAPTDVPLHMKGLKDELRKDFDLTGVLFMPVRGSETVSGWQYPACSVKDD